MNPYLMGIMIGPQASEEEKEEGRKTIARRKANGSLDFHQYEILVVVKTGKLAQAAMKEILTFDRGASRPYFFQAIKEAHITTLDYHKQKKYLPRTVLVEGILQVDTSDETCLWACSDSPEERGEKLESHLDAILKDLTKKSPRSIPFKVSVQYKGRIPYEQEKKFIWKR